MSDKELYQALEFAHYAERFREQLFVVVLSPDTPPETFLQDLRVLTAYRIRVVLLLPDPDLRLSSLVAQARRRGTVYYLARVPGLLEELPPGELGVETALIREALAHDHIPLIAYRARDAGDEGPPRRLGAHLAKQLGARKLVLAGQRYGPLMEATSRSHHPLADLPALQRDLRAKGLASFVPLLDEVAEWLQAGIPDVVLLEGRSGLLFSEVFTYVGAGLLFNAAQRVLMRRAAPRDVADIAFLIRPEIEAGRIRPLSEADIEARIGSFWVYEVDGLTVGTARLKDYGDWMELATVATLPRYRGKGRARGMALRLADEAALLGKRWLFVVGTDPRMQAFYPTLGYEPIDREDLPAAWQEGYDFTRPSKAWVKALHGEAPPRSRPALAVGG